MRDNDWGISDYPLLAGHEGVGTVTHVGPSVRTIQPGDRVGIAWMRDSCGACGRCRAGEDNLCAAGYQGTFLGASAGIWGRSIGTNAHGGCFSRVQRIEQRFAVRIPASIPRHVAATLLCAGATVYEPIVRFAFPGARVGVVGIGGLGRWALKLARMRACTVVALSSTEGKRRHALEAGAMEFYVMEGDAVKGFPEDVGKKLDLVVDTRPVNASLGEALRLVGHGGTYCRVGIPARADQEFVGSWIPTLFQQQAVTATAVTGSKHMAEMFELCDANLEFAMKGEESFSAEVVPMADVNEAMHRLVIRENKGYRYVLEW